MLNEGRVLATIAVRDIAAAKEFYGGILGLSQAEENPGGVTYASGGGVLFIYEAPSGGQNPATSATWEVTDIERAVADLKEKGVLFEHYDDFPVDWKGDIAVMGPMKSAWFKDADGNTLAIVSEGE
jgi:catechol 2,3-dioxygenase-like lactoylglutathione lyase family enzyme